MSASKSPDKSAEINRPKTLLDASILPQDQQYADMINIQIVDLKKHILSARPLDMQIKGITRNSSHMQQVMVTEKRARTEH